MTMRRAFVAVTVGITAALLIGLASVSLATEIGGTAGPAIESMGVSLAGVVGALVAFATLLVTGGRRGIGAALYAIAVLGGVAFLVWAGGRVPARPALVLSASDRVGLREFHEDATDARGSEHPSLGFRLPRTPDRTLAPSTEIEAEMRASAAPGWGDAHQIWAFETPDRGTSVMVDLSRVERADRAALAEFDRAVTGPLEAGGHHVTRGEPTGTNGCLREHVSAELTNGGHLEGGLFAFDEGTRSLRLVVTAVSASAGEWPAWIDGISLACER